MQSFFKPVHNCVAYNLQVMRQMWACGTQLTYPSYRTQALCLSPPSLSFTQHYDIFLLRAETNREITCIRDLGTCKKKHLVKHCNGGEQKNKNYYAQMRTRGGW